MSPGCYVNDPYSAGSAMLAACGLKSFPLDSVVSLPDGGKGYRYLVDGQLAEQRVPPPAFDPKTASPGERSLYGIPAEPPANTDAHAQWLALIANMHFVPAPNVLLQSSISAPPAIRGSASSTGANNTTANWSGDGDYKSGHAFTQAASNWVQPGAGNTPCSNNAAVFWSGIGGQASVNLAQDGTNLNLQWAGSGQLEAWWVAAGGPTPNYSENLVPLYATAGQTFQAITRWTGSGFEFFMENLGTGATFDVTVATPYYDGSTTEYIAERPDVNGALTPLTNYGTVNWSAAYSDSQPQKNWSQVEFDMISNSGNYYLATGGTSLLDSNGAFTDSWHACI